MLPRHLPCTRAVLAAALALPALLLAGAAVAAPGGAATGLELAVRAAQHGQRSESMLPVAPPSFAPGIAPAPAPLAARSSPLSSASLVQMPAEVIPGQYARPKYALGFRSNAMKSLAKGMGLDADTCLLPLVRARTTLSQSGEIGGRVMVFARCSFY